MNIEMLDTLEDRMAALVEESNIVQQAVSIIFRRNPALSSYSMADLRRHRDTTVQTIRHELSLLIQEKEKKDERLKEQHRGMDSTWNSIELDPTKRDSSV